MCRQAVFLKTNNQAFEFEEEKVGRERSSGKCKEGDTPSGSVPFSSQCFLMTICPLVFRRTRAFFSSLADSILSSSLPIR
jgi:hypothetical protein